jgi:hypothetical protein
MPSIVDDFADIASRANLLSEPLSPPAQHVVQPMAVETSHVMMCAECDCVGGACNWLPTGTVLNSAEDIHAFFDGIEADEQPVVIPADYDYGC